MQIFMIHYVHIKILFRIFFFFTRVSYLPHLIGVGKELLPKNAPNKCGQLFVKNGCMKIFTEVKKPKS